MAAAHQAENRQENNSSTGDIATSILIVDDDLINLLIMEKMLKNLDFDIVKAGSGKEALSLIDENDFALVLMDAQMPELNGFETARMIRSNPTHKDLPIIIVSAVSRTKEFILMGYEAGAVDYLLKPIDQLLLASKVKVFCELHEKKKQLELKNIELNQLNKKLQEEVSKRKRAEKKLLFQVIRDPLTNLFNRRYLEESLDREISKANRQKIPLALIMLDVDHFKNFNDTYGHLAGDVVLKQLSDFLSSNSRREDIACRYGGEEFVLVLPGTDRSVAGIRAEELRLIVQDGQAITHNNEELPNVTISLGIALLPDHGKTAAELIEAADKALYQAKEGGRNRVAIAQPPKSGKKSTKET